jgi:hypothetical protein
MKFDELYDKAMDELAVNVTDESGSELSEDLSDLDGVVEGMVEGSIDAWLVMQQLRSNKNNLTTTGQNRLKQLNTATEKAGTPKTFSGYKDFLLNTALPKAFTKKEFIDMAKAIGFDTDFDNLMALAKKHINAAKLPDKDDMKLMDKTLMISGLINKDRDDLLF